MKIHEYQAKQILKKYDIPIQDGLVVENENDISDTIKDVQTIFNSKDVIVKAQIHAGGRGKGGGIKYCKGYDDAVIHSNNILGMQLTTKQTGLHGKKVKKIMITEALDINKEYYIALTLDRKKKQIVIMASSEGGMDIEEVAKKTPKKINKIWVDPLNGIQDKQILDLGSLYPTRDFSYVLDTVNGFIAVYESDKTVGEVINCGSDYEISIGDLAKKIANIVGIKIDIRTDDIRIRPKKSEVQRLWSDNKKLLQLTKFKPSISLDDGLKRTIDWFSYDENIKHYKSHIYNV